MNADGTVDAPPDTHIGRALIRPGMKLMLNMVAIQSMLQAVRNGSDYVSILEVTQTGEEFTLKVLAPNAIPGVAL
jgi:hypothetical protein